jgi:hypothetical protein
MSKMTGKCPGTAVSFNYSPASNGQVPCEAAIFNVLGEMEVKLTAVP